MTDPDYITPEMRLNATQQSTVGYSIPSNNEITSIFRIKE
jgi:hypothetical protein